MPSSPTGDGVIPAIASWHPFIVHFAVAFAIGSALLDTVDLLMRRRALDRTALLLAIMALPFLAAAALTGNLASSYIRDQDALALLDQHVTYANLAVWAFTATAVWRIFLHLRKDYLGRKRIIHAAAVLIAAGCVFLAASKGGAIRHRPYSDVPSHRAGWSAVIARPLAPTIGTRCVPMVRP